MGDFRPYENDFELHFQNGTLSRSPAPPCRSVAAGFAFMIVCHCHALTDRAIREVVKNGARTQREVALACGAGRSCGGCRPAVLDVIDDETPKRAARGTSRRLAAAS
jgi:bacterioferritin-associated ferredoxin